MGGWVEKLLSGPFLVYFSVWTTLITNSVLEKPLNTDHNLEQVMD